MTIGGHNPYRQGWRPNTGPQSPFPPGPPRPSSNLAPWRIAREENWPSLRELLARWLESRARMCGLLFLLVFCWPYVIMYVTAYLLARSARLKAREHFPPNSRRRIHDPEVERIRRMRARSAAVASFLILVLYGTAEDWKEASGQVVLRLLATPWLLLLSAPVVIGLLFRLASPSNKTAMRAGLRRAMRSILWYFGAIAGLGTAAALMLLFDPFAGEGPEWNLSTALALVSMVLMMWCGYFLAFSTRAAVRTGFNTVDLHDMVPAVLTCVLMWELSAYGLLSGGLPPGPPLVQICALIGGPLSVTAVALWEISRLRTMHGVTLRT